MTRRKGRSAYTLALYWQRFEELELPAPKLDTVPMLISKMHERLVQLGEM